METVLHVKPKKNMTDWTKNTSSDKRKNARLACDSFDEKTRLQTGGKIAKLARDNFDGKRVFKQAEKCGTGVRQL